MSWNQVIGHQFALDRFRRCAQRQRLASTYLFLGDDGIGKRTFALKLAEAILCEQNSKEEFAPCGECPGCLQVQNQSHPDLLLISKPKDKNVLPIDLFIGRKTHRRREGLVYEIGMKPFRGGFRIAIIDDADYFNSESANCLLKTLEEPPPHSIIILLGTSQQRQLHTIVSRSQLVRFSPLSEQELLHVLQSKPDLIDGESLENTTVEHLASISGGSVSRAQALAEPEALEVRKLLFQQLATVDPHAGNFSKNVNSFSEALGKEGYRRRPRMVLIGELAVEFFRYVTLELSGLEVPISDEPTLASIKRLADRYRNDPLTGGECMARCIERTGAMQYHVSTNAQMLNVVESWLIDLGRILRGERVTTGDVLTGMV